MAEPIDPDAGARDALRLIGPDPQNWVPERGKSVAVVGGSGIGL